MSKDNGTTIAQAETPDTAIEMLHRHGPVGGGPPPSGTPPYKARELGENNAKPEKTEEFKVAQAPENKTAPASNGFAEKVGTERKPVNEDNKLNQTKSLSDIQPASTNIPSQNPPVPKVEAQPPVQANRLDKIKPPATSGSSPDRQVAPKNEPKESGYADRFKNIKAPTPPTSKPPTGRGR